jgi:PIN domain nuclease of toxin-antitoxin system
MSYLLDTHLLLWAAGDPDRLPQAAYALIANPANALWFSAASIWEVAIKLGLGRADFQAEPSLLRTGLLDNGYGEVAIDSRHAVAIAGLPPLHKDPFDRMLMAQAMVEGLILLTVDQQVAAYGGPVRLI